MQEQSATNKRAIKALVSILGFLIIALLAYLALLPLYPRIKYKFIEYENQKNNVNFRDLAAISGQAREILGKNSGVAGQTSINRLVIAKIGVDSVIVDSENADFGLSRGVWRVDTGSTPDKGGNTALTAHRFKYLPPNNLTFYLLDKLEAGDIFFVLWQGKQYFYRVSEKNIVAADDQSVLAASEKSTVTLFTCDPIFSEKNRLVVIGELVE